MKKRTILILTLISIFAMVVGTAMAPVAGRSLQYLGSIFIEGKGAVFSFAYTGDVRQKDVADAYALVRGATLDAHCVVKADIGEIRCTVKNVNKYDTVNLVLMGQGFYADVPKPQCFGFLMEAPENYSYDWFYVPYNFSGLPYSIEYARNALENLGFALLDNCVTPNEFNDLEIEWW